jgi:hypothetical protein
MKKERPEVLGALEGPGPWGQKRPVKSINVSSRSKFRLQSKNSSGMGGRGGGVPLSPSSPHGLKRCSVKLLWSQCEG